MKKIKILIIIFIIIIVIISIILLNQEKKTEIVRDVPLEEKIPLQREENIGSYMLVDELADNFFMYISQKSDRLNNNEAAYSILDEEYIKENSISLDNIFDFFSEYSNLSSYSTKEMYNKKITSSEDIANTFYYVRGILRIDGNIKNIYYLLKMDSLNQTYSMEFLEENEFNEIIKDINNVEETKFEIENNGYNETYVKTATDYDICLKHMEDYKEALVNNPREAYERLDEDYREKRFGSFENYEKYREEKQETFEKENFVEYLVNDYDTYKQYVCKDIYGNLYIFEESYPMEYTLKLDTYTIMTDKFKQEYDNGNDQTKVQMNIDRFILMVNNQDYDAAYNKLDNDFKNNYFESKEKFIEYVKNNMYRYNDIAFESFDKSGNVFSCSVRLTDLTKGFYEDETKGTGGSGYILRINFVMMLKDNYDFIISFEVE